ncbi:MAG: hypothetical protein RL238_3235 [Actinomycetota bacterium]|jgi:uncharacterized protein YbcC (UPF0753/DUF2309 family)
MTITNDSSMRAAHGLRHTADAVETACARIAPTWPLDQFIAVNPYWGWRSMHITDAAAHLATLSGTTLTGIADEPGATRLPLATDVRDRHDAPVPGRTWTDHVVHQVGQHCASHFDEWQSSWQPHHARNLFAAWRQLPVMAHGVRWHRGSAWATTTVAALPEEVDEAIVAMLDTLGAPAEGREAYLTALLLSVNGWAAWCAYERWQARLAGGDDDSIVELLAVRLAWEWLLRLDSDAPDDEWAAWADGWGDTGDVVAAAADAQREQWRQQAEREREYRDALAAGLASPGALPPATTIPKVQAVFCIDVRSEVIRRALEAAMPEVQTRGFAGFFGLPIAYTPAGGALTRPQLPGLLAPALEVGDCDARTGAPVCASEKVRTRRRRWQQFRSAPSSVFSFVEAMGLLYGPKLVKEQLPHHHAPRPWEHDGLDADQASRVRPTLPMVHDDPAAAAAIAARVLRAMGLTDGFAPIVVLCGHGSRSANNPHAAGLDCGACGGQTGEVNARVLAAMLDDPTVRRHLADLGIEVPDSTWFVPALHNTTTDHVTLFDTESVPAHLTAALDELRAALAEAGAGARAERAPALGLGHLVDDTAGLERTIVERSEDWSQVRPEWGLAGNAAFVVAPRARTRGLDLGGRVFLHDYDWRLDDDLSVLTLIMTAPMVVTNWINLQYHASTVDNRRYGSGNKVLHNVVGGRIGVFEGNGGDLRIGLSMQSLHDGEQFRHEPLRLAVYIEAPLDGIEWVIRDHEVVRDLVANEWLHLFRIDPSTGAVTPVTAR